MIIFGCLAPLVADEANAATADLDLCDLGCELEHCDGDHCDGGHYDEENCDWGHCDEEICDGVICDGDNVIIGNNARDGLRPVEFSFA